MGTTGVLEAIGALVIGGIFLVMMFNAYYNVNVASHNISMQVTTNQITESVSSLLDSIYLSKVGAAVDTSTVAVTKAQIRKFEFLGKSNPFDDSLSTFYIVQGGYDADRNAYPLTIQINGVVDAGPFWMSDQMTFTYYDVNENQLTYVGLYFFSSQRDLVRSVRIEFELFYDPLVTSGQQAEIKQKMVFWKYFKNLYLTDT